MPSSRSNFPNAPLLDALQGRGAPTSMDGRITWLADIDVPVVLAEEIQTSEAAATGDFTGSQRLLRRDVVAQRQEGIVFDQLIIDVCHVLDSLLCREAEAVRVQAEIGDDFACPVRQRAGA